MLAAERSLHQYETMRERLLSEREQQETIGVDAAMPRTAVLMYVNETGDLMKLHYVTEGFPKLLKANGLRHIRHHDLRHSCASLLLANVVPMKQIQA